MHVTHIQSSPQYAWKALTAVCRAHHNMHMTQDAIPKHFLRPWRKHYGLSIEALIERIKTNVEDRVLAEGEEGDIRRLGISQPNISRMERGEIPYNQTVVELIAEVYGVEPATLIMRDPSKSDALWSIVDQLKPAQRTVAKRMLEALARSDEDDDQGQTGTNG